MELKVDYQIYIYFNFSVTFVSFFLKREKSKQYKLEKQWTKQVLSSASIAYEFGYSYSD